MRESLISIRPMLPAARDTTGSRAVAVAAQLREVLSAFNRHSWPGDRGTRLICGAILRKISRTVTEVGYEDAPENGFLVRHGTFLMVAFIDGNDRRPGGQEEAEAVAGGGDFQAVLTGHRVPGHFSRKPQIG